MRIVTLGGICKVVSGSTPKREKVEFWKGTIPWVTPKEISRLTSPYLWDSEEKITEEGFNSCSTAMLPAGSVLLSSRAPIGLLAINKIPVCTNQGFKSLVPSNEVNAEYLYYVLKANVKALQARGNGATFKELAKPAVEDFKIPLPAIDDQIRIAHLLGKVEGLIAQRKQHLQQLDDLLKSVFLEMFGDPVRNEKGWDIHPCEKVVSGISSGTSYGGEDRAFASAEEVGVLKISAVTQGVFDPAEFKVVNPAQITKTLRFVKRGDFLFSRANTVELVAACCIVPQDYDQLFLPDKLWVLTFNAELISPQFFNYLLKNERYRDAVRSLANGGHDSMLNISMKKFMTLDVPCPPAPIQRNFSTIAEKVEGIKSRYQQSLNDLEALYGTLSQQAFKGELDLSRIPLISPLPVAEATISFNIQASATLSVFPMPESELLRAALIDRTQLVPLLREWLELYRLRSDNESFSPEQFLDVAQNRLEALHPENNYPLGLEAYEFVKKWVFDASEKGLLQQSLNITGKDDKAVPILGNKLILNSRA